MQIQDGRTSTTAQVDSEFRLHTRAVTEAMDYHATLSHQKYWSLPFTDVDPTTSDDHFFYIKNTGTALLSIPDIRISTTVAGYVEVNWVTGTAGGSTSTLTPVNRYLGSPNVPAATILYSVDITGLTIAGEIFRIDLDTTGKLVKMHTTGNILIPQGQAVALTWSETTGVLSGSVSLNGHHSTE